MMGEQRLNQFIIDLASDSERRCHYLENAENVMARAGLSVEERGALRNDRFSTLLEFLDEDSRPIVDDQTGGG